MCVNIIHTKEIASGLGAELGDLERRM